MRILYQQSGKDAEAVPLYQDVTIPGATSLPDYIKIINTVIAGGQTVKAKVIDKTYYNNYIKIYDNKKVSTGIKYVHQGYHADHDCHEELTCAGYIENTRFDGLNYTCQISGSVTYNAPGGGNQPSITLALTDNIQGFAQTAYSMHTPDVGGRVKSYAVQHGTHTINFDFSYTLCPTTPRYFAIYARSYGWGSHGGGGWYGGGNYDFIIKKGTLVCNRLINDTCGISKLVYQVGSKQMNYMNN